MENCHTCVGACSNIRMRLPPSFISVTHARKIHKIRLILQQPSTLWREFSVKNVSFYSDYIIDNGVNNAQIDPQQNDLQTDKNNQEGVSVTSVQSSPPINYNIARYVQIVDPQHSSLSDAQFDVSWKWTIETTVTKTLLMTAEESLSHAGVHQWTVRVWTVWRDTKLTNGMYEKSRIVGAYGTWLVFDRRVLFRELCRNKRTYAYNSWSNVNTNVYCIRRLCSAAHIHIQFPYWMNEL